tara:strand:- start:26141 stop:26716 length:576 start_codon:yes stop_codon:yes gene_type:complete
MWGCAKPERSEETSRQKHFESCMNEVNGARQDSQSLPIPELFKGIHTSIFSCEYVLGKIIRRPFSRAKLKLPSGEPVRSNFGYALLDVYVEFSVVEVLELAVEKFRDPKERFEIVLKHKTIRVNGEVIPVTLARIRSDRVPIKRNVAALALYSFSEYGRHTQLFMWALNYPLTEEKVVEHFELKLQFVNEY